MKTGFITTVTEIYFPERNSDATYDKTSRLSLLTLMVELSSRYDRQPMVAGMFEDYGKPSEALTTYLAKEGIGGFKRTFLEHFVEWDQPLPLDWMNECLKGAWTVDARMYQTNDGIERIPGIRFELDRDASLFKLFYFEK